MKTVCVWVGNYGDYAVPEELLHVRMTKHGWPDRRFKESALFLRWVQEQEEASRQSLGENK